MNHNEIHDLVNKTADRINEITENKPPAKVIHLDDPPRTSRPVIDAYMVRQWSLGAAQNFSPSGELHTAWTSPQGGHLRTMDRLFWRNLEELLEHNTDLYLSHHPLDPAYILINQEITLPLLVAGSWNDTLQSFNDLIAYLTRDDSICAGCAKEVLFSPYWDDLYTVRSATPKELCTRCNEPIKGVLG